jgi:hemolysin activation/secretion protein
MYGVWSNSETTSLADFKTVGKGIIVGSRVIVPLQTLGDYSHTAIFGVDYKDFEEMSGLNGSDAAKTPISYFPFSASYSAVLRDNSGLTAFNAGANLSFRGVFTDERKFDDKRTKSHSNYFFMTAGMERSQKLPFDLTLLAKLDGQLADQALIANEQYTGGGVESVRGYRESEASGDHAIHGVLELSAADLLKNVGKERYALTPYLFYDLASLWLKDPLPGQAGEANLQGTGIGLRGLLFGSVDFQTDLGFALKNTNRTSAGDARLHFKVRYQF